MSSPPGHTASTPPAAKPRNPLPAGTQLQAIGLGSLGPKGKYPKTLQQTQLVLQSLQVCNKAEPQFNFFRNSGICTRAPLGIVQHVHAWRLVGRLLALDVRPSPHTPSSPANTAVPPANNPFTDVCKGDSGEAAPGSAGTRTLAPACGRLLAAQRPTSMQLRSCSQHLLLLPHGCRRPALLAQEC